MGSHSQEVQRRPGCTCQTLRSPRRKHGISDRGLRQHLASGIGVSGHTPVQIDSRVRRPRHGSGCEPRGESGEARHELCAKEVSSRCVSTHKRAPPVLPPFLPLPSSPASSCRPFDLPASRWKSFAGRRNHAPPRSAQSCCGVPPRAASALPRRNPSQLRNPVRLQVGRHSIDHLVPNGHACPSIECFGLSTE